MSERVNNAELIEMRNTLKNHQPSGGKSSAQELILVVCQILRQCLLMSMWNFDKEQLLINPVTAPSTNILTVFRLWMESAAWLIFMI